MTLLKKEQQIAHLGQWTDVTLNTSAYLEPGISFKESKVGCHMSDLYSQML